MLSSSSQGSKTYSAIPLTLLHAFNLTRFSGLKAPAAA